MDKLIGCAFPGPGEASKKFIRKEMTEMKKTQIYVPEYVDFMTEWKEYQYPLGHCIVDKVICGCGYTEFVLANALPTILCSPRKVLLENKEEQHPEVHYFKNEKEPFLGEDMDGLPTSSPDPSKHSLEERQKHIALLKKKLMDYVMERQSNGKPPKIMVTYDSLHHVLDALGELGKLYYVVVDEFQSIFTDARFKADIEMNFVYFLQDYPNVLYLSATPMLDSYLSQLPEFSGLPYYELIWPMTKIKKVNITRRKVSSLADEVRKIIKDYKKGKFPRKALARGEVFYSKEVVFFVNSVRTITSILRGSKLDPSEVNIICSKDPKNVRNLKKAGGYKIGKIPGRGEKHKMFTFCTRTTYLGADFYSPCASTVICSNCTIETLAIDISLDLPQIIGRQRLPENLFRDDILMLYVTSRGSMTQDQFDGMVARKNINTSKIIENHKVCIYKDSSIDMMGNWIRTKRYLEDYVGFKDAPELPEKKIPVYNPLVQLAEKRAWEITSDKYQDEVYIKQTLEEDNFVVSQDPIGGGVGSEVGIVDVNLEYQKFIEDFQSSGVFYDKMKLYCDFMLTWGYSLGDVYINSPVIPADYNTMMIYLGPERIKALGYKQADLEEELKNMEGLKSKKLQEDIYTAFRPGQRYSLKSIKEALRGIYVSSGITKSPKASDLEVYYEMKRVQIPFKDEVTGKIQKENGYEIIRRK
jgi:hypothetical protein